jgi:predicted transposase/invertase (TIGR01784 family)
LLLFIERILYLEDRDLSVRYKEYLKDLSEEGKIVYIPFYERDEAERIKQEGWQRGRQEGRQEGKEEMARNLLASGVSPDVVAQSAGLPLDRIQALTN